MSSDAAPHGPREGRDADDPVARHEHDVRNALAAAKGHNQLLRRHLEAGPPDDAARARRHAEAVDRAIDRVVRLLDELRRRVRG